MKWVPFFFFVLFSAAASLAVVPTQAITAVRERTEAGTADLTDADKAEINKFIMAALNDIFLSKTSEEMAKTRRQILEQKGTKDLSLYATAYLTIFRDQLKTTAYAAIQRMDDPAQQLMVLRNLMILISELKSLILIEFGLVRAEDSDAVIRYWAVKSLTNPSLVQQLNSEVISDPEAAGRIYEKMHHQPHGRQQVNAVSTKGGVLDQSLVRDVGRKNLVTIVEELRKTGIGFFAERVR